MCLLIYQKAGIKNLRTMSVLCCLYFYLISRIFVLSESLFDTGQDRTVFKNNLFGQTTDWELPDQPIQLVAPDLDHKRLVIIKENVDFLYRITDPVATIAVVGKFHSGKSFLMNQLMGKSKGFGVGFTVRPKTMGIWMWGKPVQMTAKNGRNLSVLFLDTEGFAANNISENYDAKIFAVSTLLSSYLIYNSVKIIDQVDIDYLELLARRTQLFALRSQMSKAKWKEFNHDLLSFPPFMWVVQDFVQMTEEGQTPKQWLHSLMDTHVRDNEEYEISLLSIFPSVDCHTMFFPAVKKELLMDLSQADESDLTAEYRAERQELVSKIKTNLLPKEKNGNPLVGPQLASLLKILVDAANDGSLAQVPSRWDIFIHHLEETAIEDCFLFYEEEMRIFMMENNNEPVNQEKLQERHSEALERSLKLLKRTLYGLNHTLNDAIKDLAEKISTEYRISRDNNEEKIRLKTVDLQHKVELDIESQIMKIRFPTTSKLVRKYCQEFGDLGAEYFTKQMKDLLSTESLKSVAVNLKEKFTMAKCKEIETKNQHELEYLLDTAMKKSLTIFNQDTKNPNQLPRTPTELKAVISEASNRAVRQFIRDTEVAKEEESYTTFQTLLKSQLHEAAEGVAKKNEEFVLIESKKLASELSNQFKVNTASDRIALPMNKTHLQYRLDQELHRIQEAYENIMKSFKTYSVYDESKKYLETLLLETVEQRKVENINAYVKEVSQPLQRSKEFIFLSSDKYSTAFSLEQFMYTACVLNLNEGKTKHWPDDFKMNIIKHFIESDMELQHLLQERQTTWASIVGFFQWILWILNLQSY